MLWCGISQLNSPLFSTSLLFCCLQPFLKPRLSPCCNKQPNTERARNIQCLPLCSCCYRSNINLSRSVAEPITGNARRLAVSCQSGSRCTIQVKTCQLTYAADSQDQEKTRLLFFHCWRSEGRQPWSPESAVCSGNTKRVKDFSTRGFELGAGFKDSTPKVLWANAA